MLDLSTKSISLENLGIKNAAIRYQLSSDELHQETITKEQGKESSLGAIAVNTGEFTGRSPQDRFIVKDDIILNGAYNRGAWVQLDENGQRIQEKIQRSQARSF